MPGAPAAWRELSRRFGRLPFRKLFEPAIGYARYGYAISPFVAHEWEQERKALSVYAEDPAFSGWFDTFLNAGRAPRPGEIVRLKDHADTLEEIAESETAALYAGRIADIIDAFARETGGYLRKEDLSAWNPEWVDPVSINYRGYDVWELPPNGHGIVPLMALNILKGYDFTERDTVETLHRQFEAMKLAYADGKKYIARPSCMTRTVEELLSDRYAEEDPSSEKRQGNLKPAIPDAAAPFTFPRQTAKETWFPISRATTTTLEAASSSLGPALLFRTEAPTSAWTKTMTTAWHRGNAPTIQSSPASLQRGRAIETLGVMGGFMQPQGHVQVITNTLDFGMNPQEALDCPRWQWVGGKSFQVERGFDPYLVEQLRKRGHDIIIKGVRPAGLRTRRNDLEK